MSERQAVGSMLREAWSEALEATKRRGGSKRSKRDYCYASARRSCVRQMALDLIHPDERENIDTHSLERFAQGDENELNLVSRLNHAGRLYHQPFRVVGGQERFEIKDRSGNVIIVGKIDGEISFDHSGVTVVFEAKSGNSFQNVRTLEDLDRGKWTKHTLDQILAYMLAKGREQGLLVIRKPMQFPTMLDVYLEDHLDRAEKFLQDATAAVDARFGRAELPDFTDDASNCSRCPHLGKSCVPPGFEMSATGGAVLCIEPSWAEDVDRMMQTEEAARDHADLKKLMKERVESMVGKSDGTVLLPGGVVATTKLVNVKGNDNPKPRRPYSYIKIDYEKVAGGSDTKETNEEEAIGGTEDPR